MAEFPARLEDNMRIMREKDVERLAKARVDCKASAGGGLYVRVGKRGRPSWYYRWQTPTAGVRGIGHWPDMSLAEARGVAAVLERVRRERGPAAIPDAIEEVLREMLSPQCAGSIVPRGVDPEDVEAATEAATEAAQKICMPLPAQQIGEWTRKPKGEEVGKEPTPAAADEARGEVDGVFRAAFFAVDALLSAALSTLESARTLLALPSEALGASYDTPPLRLRKEIEVTPKVRK